MKGKLYLVPTPIGDREDITLRALRLLKEVDFVVCEEYKIGRRLLAGYNIEKELYSVNEHNERENTKEIIDLLLKGKSGALISDGGAPIFSDPGSYLVGECLAYGMEIIPLPGANSLVPALTASGLNVDKFYYYGWLSPKKDLRRKELLDLKRMKELIVFMETPYRLMRLIEDCIRTFGAKAYGVLAYKISTPAEKFVRGSLSYIKKEAEKLGKGEFVLLIDNRKAKR